MASASSLGNAGSQDNTSPKLRPVRLVFLFSIHPPIHSLYVLNAFFGPGFVLDAGRKASKQIKDGPALMIHPV